MMRYETPTFAEFWDGQGRAYAEQAQWQDAIAAFDKAIACCYTKSTCYGYS